MISLSINQKTSNGSRDNTIDAVRPITARRIKRKANMAIMKTGAKMKRGAAFEQSILLRLPLSNTSIQNANQSIGG